MLLKLSSLREIPDTIISEAFLLLSKCYCREKVCVSVCVFVRMHVRACVCTRACVFVFVQNESVKADKNINY